MNENPSTNRSRLSRQALAVLMTAALGFPPPTRAAESKVALVGHIPVQLQNATLLGPVPADLPVQLSLIVQVDQDLLDQTLRDLYGPEAPQKKRFLTSSEFAQKFGLAEKRQMLKDFASANGLTVNSAEDIPESMVVKVSGSASAVAKAFSVNLNQYRSADGRLFRAHATEPMIPAGLTPHLGAILGLSNIANSRRPHYHKIAAAPGTFTPAITGTHGVGGGMAPQDIQSVYGLTGVPLKGTGQTLALFELDGFAPSDITHYKNQFILPNTPVTFIGVDGITNTTNGGEGEVCLDIELMIAIAPGVTQILVYDGPNTSQGVLDTYNQIATDNTAKSVSTSWGLPELDAGGPELNSENQIFQRMATQGQSIFAASGDNGAFDVGGFPTANCDGFSKLCVDDPASQPFMTGAGGTTLTGTVTAPVERAWVGSGGGVSALWAISGSNYNYQVGVAGTVSQTHRNVPDVSLDADPNSGYSIFVDNGWFIIGGTSAAAPLWAAFTALVNQQRSVSGTGALGFVNPTLYQLAAGSAYASIFNDVVNGGNGFYNAGTGYDDTTGLGTYKGLAFINAVSLIPTGFSPATLKNIYAYPNPWDVRNPKHVGKLITIANIPDGATVKIYTLSGYFVKNLLVSGGSATWDRTNDSGAPVASGLYFYLVSTSNDRNRGTIAIIK